MPLPLQFSTFRAEFEASCSSFHPLPSRSQEEPNSILLCLYGSDERPEIRSLAGMCRSRFALAIYANECGG